MLAQIYGQTRVEVPTNHHQGIKALGKGLKQVATADDGIIEAFEITGYRFAIGVEWHPERDFDTNANLFCSVRQMLRKCRSNQNRALQQ